MTAVLDAPTGPLMGATTPRLSTPPLVTGPPGRCGCGCALSPATSLGFEAVAFAAQVLAVELLPWQRWWLIHALELRPGGGYRFRTVLTLVGRQNGKTTLCKVLALWAMYLGHARMVLGAAQSLDIAREAWAGAVEFADAVPELLAEVATVRRTNGEQCLTLTSGARYRITAATRGAGRGLSVDLLVLDELREQRNTEAWAALSKDLPNSTPILRADGGWTTMGALAAGDRIFAPSGKPTTVTDVHPVRDLRPMYRVTTTDGRSLVASESHLWTVRDTRQSWDPARAWKTLTTGQILAEGLRYKAAGAIRWRMPDQHMLCDLPERDLPISPYVLGAWLGDGTTADGTLTTGAGDLAAQCAALAGAGAAVTSTVETRPGVWRVRVHVDGRPLRVALRESGLLGDKHVPGEYLTASIEQRLALLSGLLDTDGSVTAGGDVSFTNTKRPLAVAVQFLARTLGWNARLSSFTPKIDGRACGTAWRVTFCLRDGNMVPFRLPRKAGRFTPRPRALTGTGIASIEPVNTEPSTCIAVDSADRLFLAGRDLVPTHNTTMARPNALIVGISNAGDDQSIVLNTLRSAALAETDDTLGIFEWSAPDGCELDDPAAIAQACPGLGRTITMSAVRSALATDPPAVFRTELLCQHVDALDAAVDPAAWEACRDREGSLAPARDRVAVCVDVAPDGRHVTLVGAADVGEGRYRAEVMGAWSSTDAARLELPELLAAIGPAVVGRFPIGPGAVLGPDLPDSVEVTGADVTACCQSLADLVEARRVLHSDDPLLNAHVAGSQRLRSGDGWRFARRGAGHVDAAYALAGAVHLARTLPAAPPLQRMLVI